MQQWLYFYAPDGKFLAGYTLPGTFAGELQAAKELLAAGIEMAETIEAILRL